MAKDWVLVFSTKYSHLGVIIEGLLAEENIKTFTLNKKDSMHTDLFFGDIELYVKPEMVIEAKQIINKSGL